MADRPGEIEGRQPEGDMLGSPGPDQGYVEHLVDTVADALVLGAHEHLADVRAAVGAVANKRASLYGRAPVIHDVQAAVAALGFYKPAPSGAAGERRAELLEECHHPHYYKRLRAIVDKVPAEALHQPIGQITTVAVDW
ncbi:MAG: hypothetical protein GX868_15400 [Actinobacteria bacterium]|nr:hypothetical protein [Actinomycetota bacterium]